MIACAQESTAEVIGVVVMMVAFFAFFAYMARR